MVTCLRLPTDEASFKPRKFLIDVEETMRIVLEQEDTDGNFQISVTDSGPKVLALGTVTSNAYRTFDVRWSALGNFELYSSCTPSFPSSG